MAGSTNNLEIEALAFNNPTRRSEDKVVPESDSDDSDFDQM